ncbi:peptidase M4 [Anaerocolumna cellulosilytica]|uniref:Peptidase M4 n=1 Tax=Anaerocolumna cellulosilytica TaxID=433286 RepID=A0A6S6QTE7_9FIRM|nr:YcdB/YcdC domain-containing protein [Anaerocolumna cellulosilytica]MBB5194205.1 hypothetical protein [Anaerocolumna cellulosilytica]BCJ94583.1 peptidase M4 [Anaerocolumna cellulosilytica]
MLRKKIVPVVLASCLVTAILPTSYHAWADTYRFGGIAASSNIAVTGETTTAEVKATEATAEELEKIIKAVKGKISIPSDLTVFNYNYNSDSYTTGAMWDLSWSDEDSTKVIYVTSDQNGNIIAYNNQDGLNVYAPKYLKTELKATADSYIKKVASDISGKLEYVSTISQGSYTGLYLYEYQRVENGIPMPDNTITVGINYNTGKVMRYNANWLYNAEIPNAETKITKSQAIEKIGKKVTMKLTYQNAYSTDANGKTKVKAYLVYVPDNSYVAVDAKTGEVYTTQNEWISVNTTAGEKSADTESSGSSFGLSKEEITKLDEIKGLISKEKAIAAVTGNKSLLIDDNLKSISAKLYKQDGYYKHGENTKYIWSISLNDPREIDENSKDTYRAFAYAEVDAKTGNLISYRSSVRDYYNSNTKEWESVKVKYTIDQGQKLLEDFFKIQIPDIYKNTVFTSNDEAYVIGLKEDNKEIYGGYSYNYDRVNEGVNYSYNGITGSVDGVTGKIYAFSYNWSDNVTFESPKGAMTPASAFNTYIAKEGFQLAYEINSIHKFSNKNTISTDDYSVTNEIRLVYRTDISPAQISPFTGKQLDYEGNEYVKSDSLYSYSDIGNSASAKNIKLLAELGIGFKGGEYKPAQPITAKELTDFFNEAGIYFNSSKYTLSKNASSIKRVDASKFTIQVLGFESVAKLKDIYNVNLKDQSQIKEADLGYVALAQGLGLITANSETEFRPGDNLTRGEAADLIITMLGIEK